MRAKLPIVIFLTAIIGTVFLAWQAHSDRLQAATQKALAAELNNMHVALLEEVAELETKRLVTQTEFKNVEIHEPTTSFKLYSIGPLHTRVPVFTMTRRTIKVPSVVTTQDPKIAQQIDDAQNKLLKTQQALSASTPQVSLSQQLFGIRREIAAFVFSLVILAASLFVIINKRYGATTEKWAYGSVGTILGYWLG